MPLVLPGPTQPIKVQDINRRAAEIMGLDQTSLRLKNLVKDWIAECLHAIQLADPEDGRTEVHDAEFTLVLGESTYDVREPVNSGGFGWDNCYDVKRIVMPDFGFMPIEMLDSDLYRSRGNLTGLASSMPQCVVRIDQSRLKFVPTPDRAYEGKADYYQTYPSLIDDTAKLDWPRPWDLLLVRGVRALAMQQKHRDNPRIWKPIWDQWEEMLAEKREARRGRRPGEIVMGRYRSKVGRLPHDNSRDTGRY